MIVHLIVLLVVLYLGIGTGVSLMVEDDCDCGECTRVPLWAARLWVTVAWPWLIRDAEDDAGDGPPPPHLD